MPLHTAPGPDLLALSISEVSELIRTGRVSPVELAEAALTRITALNPKLNAFITVTEEIALQQAREAEAEIQRGHWRGPLHGVPVSLKDLIDTAGVRTTAASELFKDRVPKQDAEIYRRLRVAGAVLVGKTNLHEFAYGGSALISYFGPVRNPRDVARIAGGSSGGAAAAAAAGLCFAAIGTDSAGSIRMPAALCGVTGMKPTYGAVSTRGIIPLAWSYDHAGPITRTVRDAALVLQCIAGYDEQDLGSVSLAFDDCVADLEHTTSSLRVGVARESFCADLDPEIAAAFEQALAGLDQMTAGHVDIAVPIDTDYSVHTCEAYVFHAGWAAESPNLYHPDTLRRVLSGQKVSTADYIKKRRELEHHRRSAIDLFREVDVIVTPTTPILPPVIADLQRDPKELRRKETALLRNTRPFNVLGLPAISVPCGFNSSGLPVGLQIAGRAGDDATVLALAHAFERLAGSSRTANPA